MEKYATGVLYLGAGVGALNWNAMGKEKGK